MALSNGTRLGPYEILAPIGAGGMGEVYREQDTALDRTVAAKILPADLAAREDLRAVSSLHHPHICALYGGDQAGTTTPMPFPPMAKNPRCPASHYGRLGSRPGRWPDCGDALGGVDREVGGRGAAD